MACSICRQENHDRRTCPYRPEVTVTPRTPAVAPVAQMAPERGMPRKLSSVIIALVAIGIVSLLLVAGAVVYYLSDDANTASQGSRPRVRLAPSTRPQMNSSAKAR